MLRYPYTSRRMDRILFWQGQCNCGWKQKSRTHWWQELGILSGSFQWSWTCALAPQPPSFVCTRDRGVCPQKVSLLQVKQWINGNKQTSIFITMETNGSQSLCWTRVKKKSIYCLMPFIWNSRTSKTSLWWQKLGQCWLWGVGIEREGAWGTFRDDKNVNFNWVVNTLVYQLHSKLCAWDLGR